MYEFERTVYHCDAGEDGLLKTSSAAAMMMDCCQFQEYAETKFCDWLRANDTAVFLAYMQLDILRRPAFREKMKVKVVIYDCRSIYGFRRITMRDESGKLLMISNAVGCFFNFATGKAARLPEPIGDYLTMDPAEEMEALPRKITLPSGTGTLVEPFKVMHSDLDLNRHLTSVRYLSAAEDRLPEDFHWNRMRIEFKNQVRFGETVYPYLFQETPGTIAVKLCSGEGLLNALVEYSSFRTCPA